MFYIFNFEIRAAEEWEHFYPLKNSKMNPKKFLSFSGSLTTSWFSVNSLIGTSGHDKIF